MIFKGNGVIWNPAKNRSMVNFNDVDEYNTEDLKEIEILKACGNVHSADIADIEEEPIRLSKKEIMESLQGRGINFNPRDKKEVLESLMYKD